MKGGRIVSARITAFVLVLLLLAGALLPGCSKDTVMDLYGQAVALAGNVGLTSELRLKGEREFGADRYTGTYTASYEDFTGDECPFGGTMLERRKEEHVTVTCQVKCDAGTMDLVWNCGADVPVIIADGEGTFTETAYLAPGSNYFNLVFDHFTGSVALKIE